jgi:capsid protein
MNVSLDSRQLTYLTGKIRQDILTRRRYLAKFTGRPEMPEADVQALLTRRRAELRFREDLYARLGGDPADLILEEDQCPSR